jgi:hypothetical protein
MRDDFENWLKDRDNRVQSEWPQESALQNCIDKLNQEAHRQAQTMQLPASSPGPGSMTSNGKVTQSSVQTPEAFHYVKNLQDFLLGSRAQLNRIMFSNGN